jgi:hypothetical protein
MVESDAGAVGREGERERERERERDAVKVDLRE